MTLHFQEAVMAVLIALVAASGLGAFVSVLNLGSSCHDRDVRYHLKWLAGFFVSGLIALFTATLIHP